jgi:NADPH:quinone reductase-like Zn-dependent oxidoreductase
MRAGRYLYPVEFAPPMILGYGAVGTIERVGPRVTALEPGMRVGAEFGYVGAYAEFATIKARSVVQIPDRLSFE